MSYNCEPKMGVPTSAEGLLSVEEARKQLESLGVFALDGGSFIEQPLPKPKWIIDDFIACGMKGDLVGASKSFKTYLAMHIGISIAKGNCNCLNRFRIESPHRVAYFNLELFPWNFKERLCSTCSDAGLQINASELHDRFLVYNLRGNATVLRDKIELFRTVLKSRGIEMLIIDPRYKLLKPDEDENMGSGLQGVLDLRDKLAEDFAVMLVTHDCKGNAGQKKMTDRGAGSYVAGADYDFRITIDHSPDSPLNRKTFILNFDCRARRPPNAVGVYFDEGSQTFHADETLSTRKYFEERHSKRSPTEKTKEEERKTKSFTDTALEIVITAGTQMLGIKEFESRMKECLGGQYGVNKITSERKSLIQKGILAECPELEWKSKSIPGRKKNGTTFISTPELIGEYRRAFGYTN